MAPDPLAPDALLALARRLVAPDASLSTPAQALALVVHALHSALGFRLVQPAPTEGADLPNRLPDNWPHPQGELKFRYKHDQSSLEFVISVVDLGDRLLLAGAAVDNPQRSSTFDLLQSDYFSPTSLSPSSPLRASSLSPSTPFATPTRLADLIHLYRLNILQRLVPGLSKDGYSELPAASSSSGAGGGSARAPPLGGGGAGAGPYLPDRGGPMGMFPPSGPSGSGSGGRSPSSGGGDGPAHPRPHAPEHDPLAIPGSGGRGGLPLADIGRRDLDPLGGMAGTFGGLPGGGFGGAGMGGLGGVGGGGGGMFMGPDHPLFRERFGPGSDTVGGGAGGRRWGGDGYLPPIGAPQGARFDPVGPVNGPPTGGLGGPNAGGGPLRPGQQPPQGPPGALGGFGGAGRRAHPDMEQPGTNSEWQNSMFG